MLYAQQANKPEWFNNSEDFIYASATSGSSPFNEWYRFDSREDAIEFISDNFTSQTFYDLYAISANGGDIYHQEDGQWVECGDGCEEFIHFKGENPASIGQMVWAESRF